MSRSDEWLSVQQASALVGVSPATLRRWSDAGQVSVFTTPGGHRRFARSTLLALLPAVPAEPSPLGEADLEGLREHGRRIAAALLTALDPPGRRAGRTPLAVAASSAAACGRVATACGAAWTDVVEAFLRLRMLFLQELLDGARARGLGVARSQELVLSAASACDDVLLALVRDRRAATEVTDR